ncbi:hypothetical protein BKG82_27300 [Mycobacteroides chelonae]|uniref:Uncharacterized protein n=1 Tax=Mycobacteroides chelonae TaxID=1774 RepID=A0A1S1LHU0_MYCCH|nr:hypothetical protein [Mycobacteroides chelonae]OHU47359.1 hypothetical protein BKG82_27300 [Mycobacteroides chelonae]
MTTDDTRRDPPLGACPSWCQKPTGHIWEDEWPTGPMREHIRTVDPIDKYNAVHVREYETYTAAGPERTREITLDLDASKGWDIAGAKRLILALGDAISYLREPTR